MDFEITKATLADRRRSTLAGFGNFLKDSLHSHLLYAYINAAPGSLSAFSSILPVLNINQYSYFSISMLQEQHQLLRPILTQLLGDYEYGP